MMYLEKFYIVPDYAILSSGIWVRSLSKFATLADFPTSMLLPIGADGRQHNPIPPESRR